MNTFIAAGKGRSPFLIGGIGQRIALASIASPAFAQMDCRDAVIAVTISTVEHDCPELIITPKGKEIRAMIRNLLPDSKCWIGAAVYVGEEFKKVGTEAWCAQAFGTLQHRQPSAAPIVQKR